MLKKIWQSLVRWFRKSFGQTDRKRDLAAPATLPPLDDTDREYLFMQLLEGVAHGWQQPRAIGFFSKIRHRIRKSEWLEWIDKFGTNLLNAPVPNYELAGRMVQLSQLDCGEVGDMAGQYGNQLLNRQAEEFSTEFLPIMEFSSEQGELLSINEISDGFDRNVHMDPDYRAMEIDDNPNQFEDVPPELLIDRDPTVSPPSRSLQDRTEAEDATETREITLEEFSAMLQKDPSLVAELAEQFGIETTDPQVIISAVIAQMQQQVQPISGDLTPPPPPVSPSDGNLNSRPTEAAIAPPEPENPVAVVPPTPSAPPPPPPPRRSEYKTEDPWSAPGNIGENVPSTPAKSTDREV